MRAGLQDRAPGRSCRSACQASRPVGLTVIGWPSRSRRSRRPRPRSSGAWSDQPVVRDVVAEVFGVRRGEPLVELGAAPRGLRGARPALRAGELAAAARPSAAGPRRLRHDDDRRRVLDVAVHRRLRRVVEERRQRVELALRERVELVVVADRAAGRSGPARPATSSRCGRGCRGRGTPRRWPRPRWS